MKILITSGGTKTPIDLVRHIDNMSSGTFGSKIAEEALLNGHEVIFIKRVASKSPFMFSYDLAKSYWETNIEKSVEGFYNHISKLTLMIDLLKSYRQVEFTDYNSYVDILKKEILKHKPDVVVLAAAVSDYGVVNFMDGKIRTSGDMSIELTPLPKVISKIKTEWGYTGKLIGFKLLVNSSYDELTQAATKSLHNNNCDLVIANDLRDIKNNNHKLLIVKKQGLNGYRFQTYDGVNIVKSVILEIEQLDLASNITNVVMSKYQCHDCGYYANDSSLKVTTNPKINVYGESIWNETHSCPYCKITWSFENSNV